MNNIHVDARNFCLQRIRHNIPLFDATSFPPETTSNQVYIPKKSGSWTEGFWPGQLWLAYLLTNHPEYKVAALHYISEFDRRINERIEVDHHDMGFLYSLSCVNAWNITGNTLAREAALKAAYNLTTRYLPKAGIIQAWGNLNDPEQQGRMIVDCTMNLPLLFWAWEQTGDQNFFTIATNHLEKSSKYLFRPDNSTYHTYHFDPKTGTPIKGTTHQGYSDESCWSRGQAWAIYGFALGFKHTGNESYLEDSMKAADYFLSHLPKDKVPYWDLIFIDGKEERDTSAGAIAICGMFELAQQLTIISNKTKAQIYLNQAREMLESLSKNYLGSRNPKSNALLLEGVYSKPFNMGVNEATAWGDYFFLEGLARMEEIQHNYW